MRRTASPLSLILLGLGTFLLVLAPMLAWYVTPRAAVNPIDIDQTAVYKGQGEVFDTEQLEAVPETITVTQRVRGNVQDSERSGDAVWDVTTTVDTNDTLPAADPHDALDFVPHRWVMDRKSTKPVHCCGETPYIEGEAYLKFPFDVQKRAYQWWDNTLGSTIVLTYRDTRKVQGYTGYLFTGSVPPTKVGSRLVPGALVGRPDSPQVLAEEWYSNHGFQLVVDQRTGRVIYAQTGPKRTLRAPGAKTDAQVLLDSEKIAFTTRTQKDAVEKAKQDSGQLRAIGETVPIGAAVMGFVLIVAGSVLVVRGRRHSGSSDTPDSPLTM
jgi:hypothetical protein